MADIEKVIKGLECCMKWTGEPNTATCHCSDCSYTNMDVFGERCLIDLINDSLALLKEQEARILDWEELEDWENAVWFEDKDEHKCYIALIANVGTYDAKFANVEPGNIHSLVFMRDFYMKEWRCWSARPTIKQRQAVKWE